MLKFNMNSPPRMFYVILLAIMIIMVNSSYAVNCVSNGTSANSAITNSNQADIVVQSVWSQQDATITKRNVVDPLLSPVIDIDIGYNINSATVSGNVGDGSSKFMEANNNSRKNQENVFVNVPGNFGEDTDLLEANQNSQQNIFVQDALAGSEVIESKSLDINNFQNWTVVENAGTLRINMMCLTASNSQANYVVINPFYLRNEVTVLKLPVGINSLNLSAENKMMAENFAPEVVVLKKPAVTGSVDEQQQQNINQVNFIVIV